MDSNEFPGPGVELSHILVVTDLERAKHFYRDILGATVYREYGGTSCVLQFQGSWLLLVTGGGPTRDKPGVTLAEPSDPTTVSHLYHHKGARLSGRLCDPAGPRCGLSDA